MKKITLDIRRLEQYPISGVDLVKIINIPTEFRYIFSEKNYVFYHLEFEKIRVLRVLNERQEYMQQLFGMSLESGEDFTHNE